MDVGTILSDSQSPATHAQLEDMRDIPYQRAIGSLMYAAMSTRPDIAFPIVTLSQFMQNPGRVHWEAAKHIIHYLKGTVGLGLTLGATDAGLEAYVDAVSYARSVTSMTPTI